MIRTVFFDFSKEQQASPYQFGGYEHEHNATELEVKLPATFTSSDISYITFDFQTSLGETVISGKIRPVMDTVSIPLIQQLTCAGTLLFQVVGRTDNDTLVAKTAVGRLTIEKSPYGDQAELNEDHYRVDDEIKASVEEAQAQADRAKSAADQAASHFPVKTTDIEDYAITPDKTSFVQRAIWHVSGSVGNFYFTMGSSSSISVLGGCDYLLFENQKISDKSLVQLIILDNQGSILQTLSVAKLTQVTTDDLTYNEGLLFHVPQNGAKIYMNLLPGENNPDTSMTIDCSVGKLYGDLTIPDLRIGDTQIINGSVTSDKLGDGSVTMAKLADSVSARLGTVYQKLPKNELWFVPFEDSPGYYCHWIVDPNVDYFTTDRHAGGYQISNANYGHYSIDLSEVSDGLYAVNFSPALSFTVPTELSASMNDSFTMYKRTDKVDATVADGTITTNKLADGAVTMPKLGNDVTTQLHKALSTKVINSLPADAWAILGDWKTVSFGFPGAEMEWSEWKYAQQGPLTLSGTRFDDLVLLFDLDYDDNDGYNSIDKIHGEVEIECFSSLNNGSQKTHTLSGRFYVENGRVSNIKFDLSKLEREGNPDIVEIGCLRFMVTDYLLTGMNSNLYFKNVRIAESLENRLLIMPSRDSGGDGYQEYIWAQNKWELLGYLSNESVTTEKIVDGAVTMPKLGTDVKEALSAAIKREIVDFLPPINGTVIGGRTEPFTSRSIAGKDLVSTNWFKLKSTVDLTPVTSSKQIQMTVTLNRVDGLTGSYRNGEIRLRNQNDDGNKVSYSLNNQKWHDGENQITAKISSFTSQSSPAWSHIDEVTVFTYANDSSASYTITVSDLRIVDASIQTDIEPNTIYMVKSSLPQEDNVYDEYMFINEAWEQIGSTALDLSRYYTKEETDSAIADIAGVTVHDGKFTTDSYNGVERQYIEASSGRYFMLEDGTVSLGAPDGFGGTGYTIGGQTVPEYVKCDGKLYEVTAIAPDAFAPGIDIDAMGAVQSVYILPRTVAGDCSSAFNIHMSTSNIHPDFHVTVIVRSPTMRLKSLENDPYFTVLYQDDKRMPQTYAHKDDYYTKSEIDAKVPRMVSLTAAEYEALDVKDPDTLYLVG